MIPAQNIVAWGNLVPWTDARQVEQDLIISRALVEIFSDPMLSEALRIRGGTALNKLHFPMPALGVALVVALELGGSLSRPHADRRRAPACW